MAEKILIGGDDEFEVKRFAREYVESLRDANPDLELDIIDGDNPDAGLSAAVENVVNALQTDSLFGSARAVWFKHLALGSLADDAPAPKKGKGKTVKGSDPLVPLLELVSSGIPEEFTLILDVSGMDRRQRFYKEWAAAGLRVEWFAKPDPKDREFARQMQERIRERLKSAGLTATPDAMIALSGMLGTDSARIQSEIDKLACYMGSEKKVSKEDCLAACSHTPEALSWNLTEALKEKDAARALTLADELITQMEPERSGGYELSLVSSIAGEFQNLVKIRAALNELGLDPRRVGPNTMTQFAAEKERYPNNMLISMHPFRVFKMSEALRNFSDPALVKALRDILRANRELVSGADNPRVTLERLIFDIING